jgi:hypothetical protein
VRYHLLRLLASARVQVPQLPRSRTPGPPLHPSQRAPAPALRCALRTLVRAFCPSLCVNAATARSNTCSCPRHFRADALLPLRCVPAPAPAFGSRASPLARTAFAPEPCQASHATSARRAPALSHRAPAHLLLPLAPCDPHRASSPAPPAVGRRPARACTAWVRSPPLCACCAHTPPAAAPPAAGPCASPLLRRARQPAPAPPAAPRAARAAAPPPNAPPLSCARAEPPLAAPGLQPPSASWLGRAAARLARVGAPPPSALSARAAWAGAARAAITQRQPPGRPCCPSALLRHGEERKGKTSGDREEGDGREQIRQREKKNTEERELNFPRT